MPRNGGSRAGRPVKQVQFHCAATLRLRQRRIAMRIFHRLTLLAALAAAIIGHTTLAAVAQEKSLTVFAAASMKNALDDADKAFSAKGGVKIGASYAASSA